MANPDQLGILKQGVEVWNRWRKEHPEIVVDFSRTVLRQAHPQLPARLGRERRPEQVMEIIYDAQAALMEQACNSRGPAQVIPLFARSRERMLKEAAL